MTPFQVEGRSGTATLYSCGCSAAPEPTGTIYITPCPLHTATPKLLGEAREACEAFAVIRQRPVPLSVQRLAKKRWVALDTLLSKLTSYSPRSGV
jgi:hypothetical protein